MSEYLGAAFSPYVGQWTGTPPNAQTPPWDSYSESDVLQMLEVVSTKFNKISTYGTGFKPANKPDANYYVAGAAAKLNQQNQSTGMPPLEVAQGIYQVGGGQQQAEIAAAFSLAEAANAVYPKTVTGLVFTNEYVVDPNTANAVNKMIVENKPRAQSLHIKVGVRLHNIGDFLNPPYHELKTLIQNCDFIQINIYPDGHSNGALTPAGGVKQVEDIFDRVKMSIVGMNPQCEVMIGETGWPSEGISFNQTNNTVENCLAYYEAINKWAFDNQVTTYLFEAIDEPWKSNPNAQVPPTNPWQGPNGAEGHYGLWFLNAQGGYTHKKDKVLPITQKIALQGYNQKFVSADLNRGGLLVSDRNGVQEWETFGLINVDNKVAFRAANGKYVSADLNQAGLLVADRAEIKEWETFELINVGNKVAFRAANGKYVSADLNQGGLLVADRTEIQEWEAFELSQRSSPV